MEVFGMENNLPKHYSSWTQDIDNAYTTQEAWMKGEYFDEAKRIKIYNHPKLGYIKVYQLSDGSIFGYPFGEAKTKDWEFEELTPSSLIATAQILRKQPYVFNFLLGNFKLLKYCEKFWVSYFQDFNIHFSGISDFNYSTCWSFLSQGKIKLQISIIAPFAKIEFCTDLEKIKKFEELLKNMGYLLLNKEQLELEVPNIHLENASLPVNVDMCFFEEYYKNNDEKTFKDSK